MKLEEYYDGSTTIHNDIEKAVLITPDESEELNILILNILIKYLAKYLNIAETSIGDIKKSVWKILTSYNDEARKGNTKKREELYGINCLADILQTGAIFKEIMLEDRFIGKGLYQSVDIGSSTGVLSLSSYIAGKRKGFSGGEIIMMDISSEAIQRSQEILGRTIPDYRVSGICGSALEAETYSSIDLEKTLFWISETIGATIFEFSIDTDDGEIDYGSIFGDQISLEEVVAHDSVSIDGIMGINDESDPYPLILQKLIRTIPGFYDQLKSGQIALFPNFFSKQFVADLYSSTLELRSSQIGRVPLHGVGGEFSKYEDLGYGGSRWEKYPAHIVNRVNDIRIKGGEANLRNEPLEKIIDMIGQIKQHSTITQAVTQDDVDMALFVLMKIYGKGSGFYREMVKMCEESRYHDAMDHMLHDREVQGGLRERYGD